MLAARAETRERGFEARISRNEARWAGEVNRALKGRVNPREPLCMGLPSPILRDAGMPGLKVVMELSTLRKIVGMAEKNGHKHDLTPKQVKRFYRQLADPVAVMRYGDKGYTVVTDMLDTRGRPIIVGLSEKRKDGMGRCVELVSAYGRTGFDGYMKDRDGDGRIFYVEMKKLAALSERANYPELPRMIVSRPDLSGAGRKSLRRAVEMRQADGRNPTASADNIPDPAVKVNQEPSVPVKKLSKEASAALSLTLLKMSGRRAFRSPGWGDSGTDWTSCPKALQEALTPLAALKTEQERKAAIAEMMRDDGKAAALEDMVAEQSRTARLKGKGR